MVESKEKATNGVRWWLLAFAWEETLRARTT
jgi:hypothetical protein